MCVIKAYLIEPLPGTIRRVSFNRDNRLAEMRALIGCQLIDLVRLDERHYVVVDDNGLVDGLPCVTRLADYASPLAGNLLIVGTTEDGETVDVTSGIEEIADRLTIVRPVFNPVFETVREPGAFGTRVAALEVHLLMRPPAVINVQ